MEKIASRKARNESVRFYNQTTLQTFFFIGNSVHGSLPLTFDTHPTTLKEKATIRRKITTIQGFYSLEKIQWLLIWKKIRLSKDATVTYNCSSPVFKLWLLFNQYVHTKLLIHIRKNITKTNLNTINLHMCRYEVCMCKNACNEKFHHIL